MDKSFKITIVGAGYVGMSMAVLLARKNKVTVLDINPERIKSINEGKSTVADNDIQSFMSSKKLFLTATENIAEAYKSSDYIIIATPTDFDAELNSFNTSSVDEVIEEALKMNQNAQIIIKSTLPVGHTSSLNKKHKTNRIIFSPEFLREGSALKDNLYPSRIIIGSDSNDDKGFAKLLKKSSKKNNVDILLTSSAEAEAIKLFSNTYLAMRVAFFNELDSYAMENNFHSENIIKGISFDERIGNFYNNPSFGYGGYCLPKDTNQLLSDFKNVPQSIISAVIDSNSKRKKFIVKKILEKKPAVVGFYRLTMKEGSDNFRSSATQEIIKIIKDEGVRVVIFEPLISEENFNNLEVINDFNRFNSTSDIIVANRVSDELALHKNKVFSRDVFREN